MTTPQRVHLCRWAVPTLFLGHPLWVESEDAPWSCVRDNAPAPLKTTEVCFGCRRFEHDAEPSAREMVVAKN